LQNEFDDQRRINTLVIGVKINSLEIQIEKVSDSTSYFLIESSKLVYDQEISQQKVNYNFSLQSFDLSLIT